VPDLVIQANNLGKKYTKGHQAENGRYMALRDGLMQNGRSLWRKTKDLVQGKPIGQGDTLEEVWAFKDMSAVQNASNLNECSIAWKRVGSVRNVPRMTTIWTALR
jgi:hypothetical protein